ncbi:signal peptidase I [Candidatus Babeliales bacterium]|nr:signal peptidase I [Candidatus Babeliales bacterium]
MQKLRKKFETLISKFEKKKSFYERIVERWGKRRNKKMHVRGKALLDALEKEGSELRELFDDAASATQASVARARIKAFKKLYKRLHESTKPAWRQWIEALLVAGIAALVLRSFIFGLYHVPTGSAEPTILVGDRVWGNKLAYMFSKVEREDLVIFDEPSFRYNRSTSLAYLWQKYVGLPIPLLGISGGPINVVKRVIAVPGDWIEGRMEDGKTAIYCNGKKLDEPYVNRYPLIWLRKATGILPFGSIGPLKLPGFLQHTEVPAGFWCTYDPEKSFENQPFYTMSRSEVVHIPGISSIREAYTPCYRESDGGGYADVFGPMRVGKGKYWVMGDSRKNSKDSRWFGFLDESYIHGRLSFIIYSIDSLEPFWLFEFLKHPVDFWFNGIRWNRFFKKPTY